MKTFDELVKEEDRNLIKSLIENGMYKYITPICSDSMPRIDILISYAKRVKSL